MLMNDNILMCGLVLWFWDRLDMVSCACMLSHCCFFHACALPHPSCFPLTYLLYLLLPLSTCCCLLMLLLSLVFSCLYFCSFSFLAHVISPCPSTPHPSLCFPLLPSPHHHHTHMPCACHAISLFFSCVACACMFLAFPLYHLTFLFVSLLHVSLFCSLAYLYLLSC